MITNSEKLKFLSFSEFEIKILPPSSITGIGFWSFLTRCVRNVRIVLPWLAHLPYFSFPMHLLLFFIVVSGDDDSVYWSIEHVQEMMKKEETRMKRYPPGGRVGTPSLALGENRFLSPQDILRAVKSENCLIGSAFVLSFHRHDAGTSGMWEWTWEVPNKVFFLFFFVCVLDEQNGRKNTSWSNFQ